MRLVVLNIRLWLGDRGRGARVGIGVGGGGLGVDSLVLGDTAFDGCGYGIIGGSCIGDRAG